MSPSGRRLLNTKGKMKNKRRGEAQRIRDQGGHTIDKGDTMNPYNHKGHQGLRQKL